MAELYNENSDEFDLWKKKSRNPHECKRAYKMKCTCAAKFCKNASGNAPLLSTDKFDTWYIWICYIKEKTSRNNPFSIWSENIEPNMNN